MVITASAMMMMVMMMMMMIIIIIIISRHGFTPVLPVPSHFGSGSNEQLNQIG